MYSVRSELWCLCCRLLMRLLYLNCSRQWNSWRRLLWCNGKFKIVLIMLGILLTAFRFLFPDFLVAIRITEYVDSVFNIMRFYQMKPKPNWIRMTVVVCKYYCCHRTWVQYKLVYDTIYNLSFWHLGRICSVTSYIELIYWMSSEENILARRITRIWTIYSLREVILIIIGLVTINETVGTVRMRVEDILLNV